MTKFYGTIGTKTDNTTPPQFPNVNRGRLKADTKHYVRDEFTGDVAQNDLLFAGRVPSHARLDRDLSQVKFGDFGTSITLALGIEDTDSSLSAYVSGSSTPLMTGVDIATAAGSGSALSNIAVGSGNKRLWEMLGLTADPGIDIPLWFTFAGGNPVSGTIEWKLAGS